MFSESYRHYVKVPSYNDSVIFVLEDLISVEYYDDNHSEVTLKNNKTFVVNMSVDKFWTKFIET